MTDPDIVVLRQKIHGLPAADYAAELRERLPDRSIELARTPSAERELLSRARVATGHRIDEEALAAAENLELFACIYAGTDHLPLEALSERGVAVTNAAGVHVPNVAEYVVGGILALARRFDLAWHRAEHREWRSFQAFELRGSTVTVVGLGRIGTGVVGRLEPFGVETLGVRYTPEKGGPTDEVFGFDEIHEALYRTDYLVLACPLTEATERLIDAEAFETLPPHAVVVNVARGGVIETDALVAALRKNDVGGAVLDVTDPEPLPEDHPLWGFENVLVTPHNAGYTPHYFERLADVVAENLRRLDAGESELENQVV
ncbi:MAG: D-2-hydroxyacid dehydrogenase [Salinigranum sp.]